LQVGGAPSGKSASLYPIPKLPPDNSTVSAFDKSLLLSVRITGLSNAETVELSGGNLGMGYKEADFPEGAPPTCKLDVKKAKVLQKCFIEIPYDSERIPSFCDRIIYQSNNPVNVIFYEPIFLYGDDGKLSDHLGVAGLFQLPNKQLIRNINKLSIRKNQRIPRNIGRISQNNPF
jgi:hypothetical protein